MIKRLTLIDYAYKSYGSSHDNRDVLMWFEELPKTYAIILSVSLVDTDDTDSIYRHNTLLVTRVISDD